MSIGYELFISGGGGIESYLFYTYSTLCQVFATYYKRY